MAYSFSSAANSGLVLFALLSLFYLIAQQAPTPNHNFKRSLEIRQADTKKYVTMPIKYNYVVLGQLDGNVYTTVEFGDNNQNLTMALSYDQITWVPQLPASRTNFCNNRSNEQACRIGGSLSGYFDPGDSQRDGAFRYVVPGVPDSVDATASGYYIEDKVTAGGVTVDLQFGVATSWNIPPTLGLGLWPLIQTNRPSYLAALEQQGKIGGPYTSCYYISGSDSGQLVLGGVDLDKFNGKFTIYDKYELPGIIGSPSAAVVAGDKVSVFNETDVPEAVIAPFTQFIYMPANVLAALVAVLPDIQYDDTFGEHTLPCDAQLDSGWFFELTLSGLTIRLPMSDLQTPIKLPGAENRCFISAGDVTGAGAYGYNFSYVLGGPFIRSAYVVVNSADNITAVATANPNVTTSNIVELGGPFAAQLTDLVGSTPTPSSRSNSGNGSSSNTGAIAGGVVGGVVAIAAIVGGIWFYRRRKQPKAAPVPDHTSSMDERPPELQGGTGVARPQSELDSWAAYKHDGKGEGAQQYAELSNMQPRYQDQPAQELPSPLTVPGQSPHQRAPERQPTYELAA
ncbi:hypothetical protein TWF281_002504 [Arthrobotrys megalospora]